MAKFEFDPESLRRVRANISAWEEKKKKRAAIALAFWADDVVAQMQQELLAVGAFDLGILSAATYREEVELLDTLLRVVVRNPLDYAVVIEWGRMPGGKPPPLIPLVGWAVRHGIATSLPVNVSFDMFPKEWAASAAILRNMGKGGGGSAKKHEMDPIVLDLLKVRLIARKIAEYGFVGRHPFSIAWDRKARTFKQDIAALVN
jgi:hypothetical protein